MEEIRRADRRAQGITEAEEKAAERALAEIESRSGGELLVADLPHSRIAPLADRLAAELGGPGFTHLLIRSPGEVNVCGPGDAIEHLAAAFPDGWYGGNLPESGYFGRAGASGEVLRALERRAPSRRHGLNPRSSPACSSGEPNPTKLLEIPRLTQGDDLMAGKHLFTPFTLADLHLKNRIVLAPMTRARTAADRVPNALMAEYYAQRAGAGLLITEATVVSEQGIGWVDSPGIYNRAQAEGWKQVTAAVHAQGAPIFLQLWHCGRASHSAFHGGELPVAPSAVKLEGDHVHTPEGPKPYETPRALESDEIPAIVADYARATELAREAGFDGVEVHAANGYLINQFLETKTNRRSDRYGGSLENRYRLLGEVVAAASEAWEPGRVAVRLSPNGAFNDMGSPDYRETFAFAARQLDAVGLAYLHVVDGLTFGFHALGEAVTLDETRQHFSGPLMGCCGYTAESAEAAIARGAADLVAFGRPFINNPDLPARFAHGWPLDENLDMSTWYSGGNGARGYTDFPAYEEQGVPA